MKVRINYSIELEEVPTEVKRLFNTALNEISGKFADLNAADVENPTDFVSRVSKFRTEMEQLDTHLAECQGIMQGYLSALVGAGKKEVDTKDAPEDG
tara:strand:- start:1434 stop:1724 length:291 start_codon:yes stop_codon:yes gene_type:complete